MKQIFDDISARFSKATTRTYSTSFSLGIRFLDKELHAPIYAIYGFVRFADEIVDSFHGFDKVYLMQQFRAETEQAICQRVSLNPILNSFQKAVHDYDIEWDLIDVFLQSMEMDLFPMQYDRESYDSYIVGSAEVVGLMCLHVFTLGDKKLYDRLKPFAEKLGAAFQKVNFLRDAKADLADLGRNYFPNVDLTAFSKDDKSIIEQEIEADFKEALEGIKQLPTSSKRGVYLAYVYYYSLFNKIKFASPKEVLTSRIRIPNGEKILLMCRSMVQYKLNLL